MTTILTVFFILVCIVLVLAVLLQSGQGGIGEVFGGGMERSLFGGTGAGGFLVKVTVGAAIIFIVLALTLGIISSRRGRVRVGPQAPVSSVPEVPLAELPSGEVPPIEAP